MCDILYQDSANCYAISATYFCVKSNISYCKLSSSYTTLFVGSVLLVIFRHIVTNTYVFRLSKQLFILDYFSVSRTLPHIRTIAAQGNKNNQIFLKNVKLFQNLPYNNSGNTIFELEKIAFKSKKK